MKLTRAKKARSYISFLAIFFIATSVQAQSWVDSTIATMSLRDKAAQMVWPTVLADYVPENSPSWQRIKSYVTGEKVGGFTISVGSPIEMAAKINAMQSMAATPLLFGADLEAGAGFRARGGYFLPNGIDLGGATLFPPQMAVGATGDTTLAYEMGRITAVEGRALGIHIAFAPVLDVNNNPANPVINVRSFGETPALVASMGRSFIRGLQEHGMIATGKHFPGHGDTGVNSHLALPVITASRARLENVELIPFRAAIDANVGAIMSFHGVMTALDSSGVPGTLSPKVLTDLLRTKMKFQGLVISDAMDMQGVLRQFGAQEAVKRAVVAGVDVLIQPVNVKDAIDAVVDGVEDGRYTEERLNQSVHRILEAKEKVGLNNNRFVALDSIRSIVGDTMNLAVARTIAERSIKVMRNKDVPVEIPIDARVLSVTIARRADLNAGVAFNNELRKKTPQGGLVTVFIDVDDPAPNYARLDSLAQSSNVLIVSSYVGQRFDATTASAPGRFVDFINRWQERGKYPIVIAFGNPYLIGEVPGVENYIIAWGGNSMSQAAAAKVLTGSLNQ